MAIQTADRTETASITWKLTLRLGHADRSQQDPAKFRFFYWTTEDGKGLRKVTVTSDRRISCNCSQFEARYKTGEGDICECATEALAFVDYAGFRGLTTRDLDCKAWRN